MKYVGNDRRIVPCNTPIWGLAYDINNETEYRNHICKPTMGEIEYGCFFPYKKGTTERRRSGAVSYLARQYADTYEEAVDLFNTLVTERIDTLYRLIDSAQKDMIPVIEHEGDT